MSQEQPHWCMVTYLVMTTLQSTWSTSFVARLIDTVKQQDFTVAQMEMIQHVQGQNHIGMITKMNFH